MIAGSCKLVPEMIKGFFAAFKVSAMVCANAFASSAKPVSASPLTAAATAKPKRAMSFGDATTSPVATSAKRVCVAARI